MESFPTQAQTAAPLRTLMLQEALANAAALGEQALDIPEVQIRRSCLSLLSACGSSPPLCLLVLVVLALCTLLVLRPPFVLQFDHDARRPWKGSMRLSWLAVFFTIVCTIAIAAGVPVMLELASRTMALVA